MKKLLILSGKGGTGKTTVAAAFIDMLQANAFADCDVDAPNLHIVANLDAVPERKDYYGSQKAIIDMDKCVGCGACFDTCRFGAITPCDEKYQVDEYACEGCSVCELVCPEEAVAMQDDVAGEVRLYRDNRLFSTAELKMGRGNSGKLVSEVKKQLDDAATVEPFAIIDGSPGIGCPVIASISGVDLVLIVAEPSVSGMSDMERILKTTAVFNTKAVVCVNKWDINPEMTKRIEDKALALGAELAGRIRYDRDVTRAQIENKAVVEIDAPSAEDIRQLWAKLKFPKPAA